MGDWRTNWLPREEEKQSSPENLVSLSRTIESGKCWVGSSSSSRGGKYRPGNFRNLLISEPTTSLKKRL